MSKICVTADGKSLDAGIDPRFGRCRYFIFVDLDSMALAAVENPNAQFAGGAGIQSGQFVISKGVKIVLTGNMGPNAFKVLESAGIEVVTGVSGKVSEAVENYKAGRMKSASSPSVSSKFGQGKQS
ncbi:MAG TPA: NifB/NifX family molybdenum-iron cluster-binding protein [Candidatus Omnitrophota bacterium]|nr:NifB/NifX family molybdenum-iron cluster-binding protein [Candidatus Omnitrophota bacterium]